jgi:malonyl-CoA O-methyltransferase
VIVDAGCGTGELARALATRYPEAKIHAVDTAAELLAEAVATNNVEYRLEDAAKLSLPDHSVDLLCANFLLPWAADANACLREWQRVLAPNGLLMVSVLGVSTLQELKASLPADALPGLIDMHDLGDALVTAGFADPVMDTSIFPVRYRDAERMQHEQHASGLLNKAATIAGDTLSITMEIVHGHAFVPPPSDEFKSDADGLVRIPLSHLRRARRS